MLLKRWIRSSRSAKNLFFLSPFCNFSAYLGPVNRVSTYLIFLLVGFFGSSCKSKLYYSEGSLVRLPQERVVPYKLTYPLQSKGKLLVVIPDDPDTNRRYYAHILEIQQKKFFDIMIIGKPGEDYNMKRSLDDREERIEDVVTVLNASDSLYRNDLILLGSGQGAYILPALQSRLKAKAAIFINAGVLSPLAELEYIARSDSLSKANDFLLHFYGIEKIDMLQLKVDLIKKETFGSAQLAPSSNRCWQSYYNYPLITQLNLLDIPVLWFNYESYPLLSVPGIALTDNILSAYQDIQYSLIKEAGKNKEEIVREKLHTISKR